MSVAASPVSPAESPSYFSPRAGEDALLHPRVPPARRHNTHGKGYPHHPLPRRLPRQVHFLPAAHLRAGARPRHQRGRPPQVAGHVGRETRPASPSLRLRRGHRCRQRGHQRRRAHHQRRDDPVCDPYPAAGPAPPAPGTKNSSARSPPSRRPTWPSARVAASSSPRTSRSSLPFSLTTSSPATSFGIAAAAAAAAARGGRQRSAAARGQLVARWPAERR